MKHKIFILSLFILVTVGSFVMADYVDPTSSAPSSNTGSVVKTGPDAPVRTFEKIGTGGTCDSSGCNGLANFFYQGIYTDKLVAMGATQIDGNIRVFKRTGGNIDQYINTFNFNDPNTQSTFSSKPIEALIPASLTSQIIVSNQESSKPAYTLQLEPSNGFSPTTNIGLGDSCTLYTAHLVSGCPRGYYISQYKNPTFSGTLSSSNNTNNQVVATCTEFKPSASPTNTGNCDSNTTFVNFTKTYLAGTCTAKVIVNVANTANVSGRAKNPKIGVAWVSGLTTPDHTVSPSANTILAYTSSASNCMTRSDFYGDGGVWKFYVTDDLGQYYEHQI